MRTWATACMRVCARLRSGGRAGTRSASHCSTALLPLGVDTGQPAEFRPNRKLRPSSLYRPQERRSWLLPPGNRRKRHHPAQLAKVQNPNDATSGNRYHARLIAHAVHPLAAPTFRAAERNSHGHGDQSKPAARTAGIPLQTE